MKTFHVSFGEERDITVNNKTIKYVGQFEVFKYSDHYEMIIGGVDECERLRLESIDDVLTYLGEDMRNDIETMETEYEENFRAKEKVKREIEEDNKKWNII